MPSSTYLATKTGRQCLHPHIHLQLQLQRQEDYVFSYIYIYSHSMQQELGIAWEAAPALTGDTPWELPEGEATWDKGDVKPPAEGGVYPAPGINTFKSVKKKQTKNKLRNHRQNYRDLGAYEHLKKDMDILKKAMEQVEIAKQNFESCSINQAANNGAIARDRIYVGTGSTNFNNARRDFSSPIR
jgi:hypothetical protein